MTDAVAGAPSDTNFVVIAHFLDSAQAAGAQAALEGAGLSPRLRDCHVVGINWLYAPAIGGVRLEVPQFQRSEAIELLEQASPDEEPLSPDDVAFFATARSDRRARCWWGIAFLLVPGLAALGLLMATIGPPWKDKRDVG
jgi:hypothetical protein